MGGKYNFDRILTIALVVALVVGLSFTLRRNFDPVAAIQEKGAMPAATAVTDPAKAQEQAVAQAESQAQTLADVEFSDAAGAKKKLSDFKGQVLLVNLWATWCPPCVAELPALDSLQARLRERGLKVVAISLDPAPVEKVAAFLNERDAANLDLYWDADKQIPLKWKYEGVPASFLVNREGRVLKTYMGPQEWVTQPVFGEISAAVK